MPVGRSVDDDNGQSTHKHLSIYFSSDCEKNSQKNSDVDLLVRVYLVVRHTTVLQCTYVHSRLPGKYEDATVVCVLM